MRYSKLDTSGFDGDRKLLFLNYDVTCYPFAQVLARDAFWGSPLQKLHEFWRRAKLKNGKPAQLSGRDSLYLRDQMRAQSDTSPFYKLYHKFILQELAPHFGGTISYSMHPEMRVHLAGTPACSAWHTDVQVTGRFDQINVWLPFVDVNEANSLWIESDYGRHDYRPVPVKYGQALIFDGGCLSHGTVANEGSSTRVSADFRFAVKSFPPPENATRIHSRTGDKLLFKG